MKQCIYKWYEGEVIGYEIENSVWSGYVVLLAYDHSSALSEEVYKNGFKIDYLTTYSDVFCE